MQFRNLKRREYIANTASVGRLGEIISRRMQMGSGEERRPLCFRALCFRMGGGEEKKKKEKRLGESIGTKSCCRCEIVYDTWWRKQGMEEAFNSFTDEM